MQIVVHGGAGSTPEDPNRRQAVLEDAALAGSEASTPSDAVREAVRTLEASPRFNAGVGGAAQSDGVIRTDAGLMVSDGSVGAAAGLRNVAAAIDVADAVRTETPHVLLTGREAVQFAREQGVATDNDLWTDRSRSRWAESPFPDLARAEQLAAVRAEFGQAHDTVGAVATDGDRVAAATSTGGRWFALAGRVGDVPQVGCGFYASTAGAVSTTGAGEGIARVTMARIAEQALADGAEPGSAAARALEAFETTAAGSAGLIVITPEGDHAARYSSEMMQTAVAGQ